MIACYFLYSSKLVCSHEKQVYFHLGLVLPSNVLFTSDRASYLLEPFKWCFNVFLPGSVFETFSSVSHCFEFVQLCLFGVGQESLLAGFWNGSQPSFFFSLSHTHTHTLSLSKIEVVFLFFNHLLLLCNTFARAHTLTLTHTYTHSLSLSLSLSGSTVYITHSPIRTSTWAFALVGTRTRNNQNSNVTDEGVWVRLNEMSCC